MPRRLTRPPLQTGGRLWGPERVRRGISLGQLSAATGIARGSLSGMESGRIIATTDEFDRIWQALHDLAEDPA